MKPVSNENIPTTFSTEIMLTDLIVKKMHLIKIVIMFQEWWNQTQMTAKLLKMKNK
jgi:hypothetical protein